MIVAIQLLFYSVPGWSLYNSYCLDQSLRQPLELWSKPDIYCFADDSCWYRQVQKDFYLFVCFIWGQMTETSSEHIIASQHVGCHVWNGLSKPRSLDRWGKESVFYVAPTTKATMATRQPCKNVPHTEKEQVWTQTSQSPLCGRSLDHPLDDSDTSKSEVYRTWDA